MKEFDKIIGYTAIKRELEQIADIFRNREVYDNLGVKIPVGVLLHGVPGVGKSLMANSLIEASGLECFTCRKDRPDGDFINYIKETFDKAAAAAPSIVFLDDMDKFANGDERHPDCEEYVTVQSCIDESRNKDILVLATANTLRCLPNSLLRAGRFDRIIRVGAPDAADAEKIVEHYLSSKKAASDLDSKAVAKIMNNHSCAELETVINEAGIYAGFDRSENIGMEHFLKAAMRVVYGVSASAFEEAEPSGMVDDLMLKVAYHEAGHALIHEVFDAGSVALVSMYGSSYDDFGGLTVFRHGDSIGWHKRIEIEIIGGLAGMAATEQKFGTTDIGCSSDLEKTFGRVRDLIVNDCTSGFNLHGEYGEYSNDLRAKQEQAVAAEVEKYYRRAKEIISQNTEFFEAIAQTLLSKKILSSSDIENLRQ